MTTFSRASLVFAAALAPLVALLSPSSAYAEGEDAKPVENYRRGSFAITSGMDLISPFVGNNQGWNGAIKALGSNTNSTPHGVVGLGLNARGAVKGFVIGGQFGVTYFDGLSANPLVTPGISFGYAIPMTDGVALTPSARAVAILDTGGGSNSQTLIQATGELAAEIFFGKHAFLEPVLSVGDFHGSGAGVESSSDILVYGVGYRLGLVF
jgi:hypothetical protein